MICPKCDTELTEHENERLRHGSKKNYCPTCKGQLWKRECVACNVTFYEVEQGRNEGHWNNHQCDPSKINKKEAARNSIEDRCARTPSEAERLAYGNELLGDQ